MGRHVLGSTDRQRPRLSGLDTELLGCSAASRLAGNDASDGLRSADPKDSFTAGYHPN